MVNEKLRQDWPAPGICEAVHHFIRVQWFLLLQYFFGNWWTRFKPATKTYKKLLIIGDGVAGGYGDYATCAESPGLVRHLYRIIAVEPTLRLPWKLINCGLFGTTSDDWSPECKAEEDSFRSYGRAFGVVEEARRRCMRPTPKPLWKKVFDDKRYRDAEVVIVCVGLNDSKYGLLPDDPKSTLNNIKSISEALLDMKKEVILCTIPLRWRLVGGEHAELFTKDYDRNCLIAQYVEERKCPQLTFGIDFGARLFNNPAFYSTDAVHLCSAGYKKWASEMREALVPAMVRVEARTWKDMLAKHRKVK
ncbi:hypothetical protein AAMO2058_001535000 [Amorphochlora amoebiformis]|uniref:SGNH hydrolase-type esterase domain-containing protein n=1 Tax=Amorphochlora amoebiformis TaxID=1561963 RepID=A0A7S0DA85_9EUKA|mmetsp:Transcript_22109/g.34806  ORF Transcript_22109/g.34806 Transcript_22109/m.34806 type:complete len:305 (+) Transcript_22109:13-927(+)